MLLGFVEEINVKSIISIYLSIVCLFVCFSPQSNLAVAAVCMNVFID